MSTGTLTLGDTHRMWRDAVPATSFPFRYTDRTSGTIVQTWRDVKEKINRDALNPTMPFCTGHYAPSQLQNLIVSENNSKAGKHHAKLQELLRLREERQRLEVQQQQGRPGTAAVAPPAGARPPRPQTAAVRTGSTPVPPNETPPQPPTPHQPAGPPPLSSGARPMSATERSALYDGEGGGRSRKAFLKLRRQLPTQHRFDIVRTTSQCYGWEQLDTAPTTIDDDARARAVKQASLLVTGHATRGAKADAVAPVTEFRTVGSGPRSSTATAAATAPVKATSPSVVPPKSRGTAVLPQPGEPDAYYGRRSFMAQLTRRRGVFAKADGV